MGTELVVERLMHLPASRGPLSAWLIDQLRAAPGMAEAPPPIADDPLRGDDLHLALYLCYELHYSDIEGVSPDWEWDPKLLRFRAALEAAFEGALLDAVPAARGDEDVPETLRTMARDDSGPSLSEQLGAHPDLERFREFVMHRSAYQLKEADPHSWALARLGGKAKAALIEIQMDEYGSGRADAMHSVLFAQTMAALDLDPSYGAYIDRLPGVTLATVNLMSMFGLHRRWRGAIVGHLALFEMTSTEPNRRYGGALRKLGYDTDASGFFDVHVEADAVHEAIAAYDLAGGLVSDEPARAPDILFGARCLDLLERRWAEHLLQSWESGRSSLL